MATVNLQVAAGADDADEAFGGTMDVTDSSQVTCSGGSMWAGLRFQNVTIPQAATVTAATLEVYFTNSTNDVPGGVAIYAQAADNAGQFTTTNSDISSRSRTTANVTWSGDAGGSGWKSAPDLATVVQEVVNRGGWASGNALVLIMDGATGSDMRFRSYEFDTTLAAKLSITYTSGGAMPKTARVHLSTKVGGLLA